MHADAIIDADRYTEQIGKQQDAFETALEKAEFEIRTGFAVWFSGQDAVVPCAILQHGPLRVLYQPVAEAVDDTEGYKDTLQARNDLLQGRITVEQFRDIVVNRYVAMRAEDIAEVWGQA